MAATMAVAAIRPIPGIFPYASAAGIRGGDPFQFKAEHFNAAPATAGPISLMGSISNLCTDEHDKCGGKEAAEEEEKDPADQQEEEGGYLETRS
jgi:hypothetical protein